MTIRSKLCKSGVQTQSPVNLIKCRFARVDKFFFPIRYRWLAAACACFIVSTLAWKIKAKLIWRQNCAQVQSVGVSAGKPCSLLSCGAVPVADLVPWDCSYSFLGVVGSSLWSWSCWSDFNSSSRVLGSAQERLSGEWLRLCAWSILEVHKHVFLLSCEPDRGELNVKQEAWGQAAALIKAHQFRLGNVLP